MMAQVNNVIQVGGSINSANPFATIPLNSSLTGLITLIATVNSSTAGNVLVFYKNGVQYQVTTAKTFVSIGWSGYASTSTGIAFGFDTASFSNDVAVGTLAAPVYYSGASGKTYKSITSTEQFFPQVLQFAATRYPFLQTTSSTANVSITMMGFEF